MARNLSACDSSTMSEQLTVVDYDVATVAGFRLGTAISVGWGGRQRLGAGQDPSRQSWDREAHGRGDGERLPDEPRPKCFTAVLLDEDSLSSTGILASPTPVERGLEITGESLSTGSLELILKTVKEKLGLARLKLQHQTQTPGGASRSARGGSVEPEVRHSRHQRREADRRYAEGESDADGLEPPREQCWGRGGRSPRCCDPREPVPGEPEPQAPLFEELSSQLTGSCSPARLSFFVDPQAHCERRPGTD